MHSPIRNLGLFGKIFGIVLMLVVVANLVLVYFISDRGVARTRLLLQSDNHLLAVIAGRSIEAGFSSQQIPYEMLSAVAHSPRVAYWLIVRPDGRVRSASRTDHWGAKVDTVVRGVDVPSDLSHETLLSVPDQPIDIIILPLALGDPARPHSFWLAFRTDEVQKMRNSIVATNVACMTGLVLFLGLALYLILSRVLTRPLRAMISATVAIAHGDLGQKISVKSTDELGRLASSFNKMADDLKQAQTELVQSEKMGMLGELVAGVAHEINTPTGAIMNVANGAGAHLRDLVTAMPGLCLLPEDLHHWLIGEAPRILSREANFSETMDHRACRGIEGELERQGVANARRVAEVLIDCGLTPCDTHATRCLSHDPALRFLESLIALRVGAEISLISVQKIAKIIRALRYYSRSGEGDLFDIDVNESLDNTLVILQNRIKRIAKVERHYGQNIPPVRCGPDLSQVWTNILSNACDAIESSGQGEGLIRVATSTRDRQAVVEIYNVGPSIPKEVIPKIFDPFFTTKPIGKGTGLGLSICVGILREYHGSISARNDPGGVTFGVTLPLGKASTPGTIGTPRDTEALVRQTS